MSRFPVPATVLTFSKSHASKRESRNTKLNSVACTMLRANLPSSPAFVDKAKRLHAVAPDMAAIVEQLIDELLEDCG